MSWVSEYFLHLDDLGFPLAASSLDYRSGPTTPFVIRKITNVIITHLHIHAFKKKKHPSCRRFLHYIYICIYIYLYWYYIWPPPLAKPAKIPWKFSATPKKNTKNPQMKSFYSILSAMGTLDKSGVRVFLFPTSNLSPQLSNEKRAPGCLGYIMDEILPSYMGIIMSARSTWSTPVNSQASKFLRESWMEMSSGSPRGSRRCWGAMITPTWRVTIVLFLLSSTMASMSNTNQHITTCGRGTLPTSPTRISSKSWRRMTGLRWWWKLVAGGNSRTWAYKDPY